jgi:chromosome segregation ATPase
LLELKNLKNLLESDLRDTKRNLVTITTDRDRLLQQTIENSQRIQSIEKEKTSLQNQLYDFKSQTTNLTQQLKDLDTNLQKTMELNRSCEENKLNLGKHIESLVNQQNDLNTIYNKLQEQYKDSQQLVQNLVLENKGNKEYLLTKNEVIKKQEIIIQEMKRKSVDYEDLYKKEQEKNTDQDKLIKKQKKHLDEFGKRYLELENHLKKSDAVSWRFCISKFDLISFCFH